MKRETVMICAFGFVCWVCGLCSQKWAHADSGDDVLWLARAMIAEADFVSTTDHAALAHVLIRKAERIPGLSIARIARVYCSGLGPNDARTPRLKWVIELNEAGMQPKHWPKDATWEYYRPLWLAAMDRAQNAIAGTLPDPCRGRAAHWGSPTDTPPRGLRRIDCGDTANIFYAIRRVK